MHMSFSPTRRVLVFLFVLIGVCAFVGDLLNPATPTPVGSLRVAILAQLLLAAIRLLMPCGEEVAALQSDHSPRMSGRTLNKYCCGSVLDMICVRLN